MRVKKAAAVLTMVAKPATGIAEEISRGKKRNLRFGNYDWRVLDVEGDKALLITEDVIEQRPFDVRGENVWEKCSLRAWLNGEFLQEFTTEERGKINGTQDKIFLLSVGEANSYFATDGDRLAKFGNKTCWWWLRSPGYFSSYAPFVTTAGIVIVPGSDVNAGSGGVRPAFWLNLKS